MIEAAAEPLGVPPEALEYQMIYGMAEPFQHAMVAHGRRVRLYTPVGRLLPGMAYLVRRLLENTSNESFLRKEYERLQGAVTIEKTFFDSVTKRIRELNITGNVNIKQDIKILEPATMPLIPIRPNKRMIMVYSMVLGLGLSAGLIWVLQMLDSTIKSVDQAERQFGLPVLGAVPKNKLPCSSKITV